MNHSGNTRRPLAAIAALLISASTSAQTDYHEQSLGFHLARYIALKSTGYRMVSLDVAGDLADQRWSAVWESGSGPDWTALHGVSLGDLVTWQGARLNEGYRVSWLTSAGAGNARVYGCIMVKDGLDSTCYHDLTPAGFDSACDSAHGLGQLLVSASVHGTAADPRYAAVFRDNPGRVRWGVSRNDSPADHQAKFTAFVGQAWARPAIVTLSASSRYLSVYRDDEVGGWVARHDLTKAGYETQRNTLAGAGFRPLQIMVAGSGSATRYAALFVKGAPAALQRTVTGIAPVPLAGIDEIMIGKAGARGWLPGFMQDKNVRAAAVAIAKDGNLVFARGYTWAAPGYPTTQPTTGFRLASCSKPLTAMATYRVDEQLGNVTLGSRLVDLVPLGTPKDPRVADITLTHLMNHRSGYGDWWGDGCTDKLAAAQKSVGSVMLDADPGAEEAYSNPGYAMLGLMIEQQTGLGYFDYLRQHLLAPLGINRAHLITGAHQAGDAHCQEMGWGGSRVLGVWASPAHSGNPIVNGAYAIRPEAIDAAGGVTMSAVDYVRLLSGVFDRNVKTTVLAKSTRDAMETMIETSGRTGGWDRALLMTGNGKVYRYYEKGGQWRSAHTWVVRRSDGVSIAAFCNGPSAPPIAQLNAMIDAVTTWPQTDLFPTFGLPPFVKGGDGSLRQLGIGCSGSNGMPDHMGIGTPEIGKSVGYHLHHGPTSSPALLLLGLSNQAWGGLSLPLTLSAFGAPHCRLYVSPDASRATTTYGDGSAGITLPLPNDGALIGARLFTQYAALDGVANQLGFTFSNGLETVIGGWR